MPSPNCPDLPSPTDNSMQIRSPRRRHKQKWPRLAQIGSAQLPKARSSGSPFFISLLAFTCVTDDFIAIYKCLLMSIACLTDYSMGIYKCLLMCIAPSLNIFHLLCRLANSLCVEVGQKKGSHQYKYTILHREMHFFDMFPPIYPWADLPREKVRKRACSHEEVLFTPSFADLFLCKMI